MEGHPKFLGVGGSLKSKFVTQSMKVNCNFLGDGYGYFLELYIVAHSSYLCQHPIHSYYIVHNL